MVTNRAKHHNMMELFRGNSVKGVNYFRKKDLL